MRDPRTALSAAEQLRGTGDVRSAIDLLTDENRIARNAEIERALIELRHEAALASIAAAAADVPTEVCASRLAPRLLAAGIERRGYLIVRDLLDAASVARLRDGIDKAFAARDAHRDGRRDDGADAWYTPFPIQQLSALRPWLAERGGLLAGDSPACLFDIVETYRRCGLMSVVAGYLGEEPLISVDKCTLRRVAPRSGIEWHQDGAFLGRHTRALNAWVALSDAGRDAPGLDIVPGRLSEVVPTGTGGATYPWSVGADVVASVSEPFGIVSPEFGPGDALLFDPLLLHRTAQSDTHCRTRHAIETWFFAASTYPDQQQFPILV
jgi:hypothetical protein